MKVFVKRMIEYLSYNPEKHHEAILRRSQEELKAEKIKTKHGKELLEKSKNDLKAAQEELMLLKIQDQKEKGMNPFKLIK